MTNGCCCKKQTKKKGGAKGKLGIGTKIKVPKLEIDLGLRDTFPILGLILTALDSKKGYFEVFFIYLFLFWCTETDTIMLQNKIVNLLQLD